MRKRTQPSETKVDDERIQTYELKLSRKELVHLRDLFGIKIPPEMAQTLSEGLADACGSSLIEKKLWVKIASLLNDANIPQGDECPDFTIVQTCPLSLGVFRLNEEE